MPDDVYYIEINNRRCPGPSTYVLEPDTGGDYVRLQEKAAGNRRQQWQAVPTLDAERQFSGVALYNLALKQALRFAGRREPLRMATWHQDQHDPTFAWALRPSASADYRDECALMSAAPEWCYYVSATGEEPCTSAAALAWEWRGNANQMWVLRPVS